jgi:hypothetical protein
LALVAAILIPRVLLIWRFRSSLIESDEAVIGLMARHILAGEWSVFYWGQQYLGSVEAVLSAIPLWLFGTSPLILKLVPLSLFLGFVYVHHRLAREILPRGPAFWATAMVGCSPAFLMIWSMKSRGYMPAFLLGTAALWVAVRILRDPDRRSLYGWLGLLLGLSWWSQFLAAVYIFPIAVMLLLLHERRVIRRFPLLLSGFLIGSLPFWVYNLTHHWSSLALPGVAPSSWIKDLATFFGVGLPILVGARPNWGHQDLFPFASILLVGIPILSAGVVTRRVWSKHRANPGPSSGRSAARELVLLFALSFPLVLSSSGFAWFMDEPRYLIPLYSVLFILIVDATRILGRSWRRSVPFAAMLWIVFNLVTTFRITPEEFIAYTNTEDMRPLETFLEKEGVTRAFASYWVAYRLAFETGERIIATPVQNDTVRYEPYWKTVSTASKVAYIRLVGPVYSQITRQIEPPPGFTSTQVGKFVVFLPPGSEH